MRKDRYGSCIYECKLKHVRTKPKENRFTFSVFMFYIDLDELDKISGFSFFSVNRWNIFSFYDDDHFKFLKQKGISEKIAKENVDFHKEKYSGSTKDKMKTMISELKLGFEPHKIFLLTNARNFGYVFNPVSFYYCFDNRGKLRAMFSEVNNTFGEQKMYYTIIRDPDKKIFTDKQRKNYYISPFVDYDTDIHWKFNVPGKHLYMEVDSKKGNDSHLCAEVKGRRKDLTGAKLFYLNLRYPLITFWIIFMIHYQALKLAIKKVPFRKKKETDRKIIRSMEQ